MKTPLHNEALGYGALASLPLHDQRSQFARLAVRAGIESTEARHEADTDELTGLMNRRALYRDIAARIEGQQPFGVLFADLTNFKRVNDTFDHAIGDQYLITAGKIIRRSLDLRSEDVVGRLGGDEFVAAVSLEPRRDPDMTPEQRLGVIASRIVETFDEKLRVCQLGHLGLGLAIGQVVYNPETHRTAADILSGADQHMTAVKDAQHQELGTYRPL